MMEGWSRPWFICGGWAIDLFLGELSREHEDIEVGVFRDDQEALRSHFAGRRLEKVVRSGAQGAWVLWEEREHLMLPVHQVRVAGLEAGGYPVEFLLHERDGSAWSSRRHPGLTRAIGEVVMESFLGVPILVPEVQLLFKAKGTREKDDADLVKVLPRMALERSRWLLAALEKYHAGHEWIHRLKASLG